MKMTKSRKDKLYIMSMPPNSQIHDKQGEKKLRSWEKKFIQYQQFDGDQNWQAENNKNNWEQNGWSKIKMFRGIVF